ncbi:MAG: hypothetical protein GYA34_07270 [Chloroflexi bacterium]|nr:hypothetical protein [Chloroflexota bacterium]
MFKKSSREIEFAIQMAISALRREIDQNSMATQLGFDGRILYPERQVNRFVYLAGKRQRDLEKAIAILKAIKAGVYESVD